MTWRRLLAPGLLAGLLLTGAPTRSDTMTLRLSSSAFADGGTIPVVHTCDGENLLPPLTWSGIPAGTRSLALIVEDPDAPDPRAPKTTWTHWIVYDLPPATTGVAAGARPAGAREGLNDWHRAGYGGPCPPIGRHRYIHRLYALDVMLGDLHQPTRAALLRAIQGHVLAQAQLVGTYSREAGGHVSGSGE